MTLADKNVFLCTCNGTMPLDADAIARATGASHAAVHTAMCQRELGALQGRRGRRHDRRLHAGAAAAGRNRGRSRPASRSIRFVNIRETAGWSAEASQATPKIAALLAAAALPDPEPVPSVAYKSEGQLLIVGPLDAALRWAEALRAALSVTVLATERAARRRAAGPRDVPGLLRTADAPRRLARRVRRRSGRRKTRSTSTSARAATRASTRVPEQAIDCELPGRPRPLQGSPRVRRRVRRRRRHRFRRGGTRRAASASTRVLDLRRRPMVHASISRRRATSRPAHDPLAQAKAAAELALIVGEFEKPKYFAYKPSICAHSRSREDRLHAMHRRLLDARHSRRRRPHRRRAASVHGLRRAARRCARPAR